MTGHVFHPGHDEWHGQTVVVYTNGANTMIGRWDAVDGDQVRMMDVAVHDSGASDEAADAWVARLKKYGIPVEQRTFAFPQDTVERVVHLTDA